MDNVSQRSTPFALLSGHTTTNNASRRTRLTTPFLQPPLGLPLQNLHRFRLDLGIGQRAFTITLVAFLKPPV